MLLLKRDRKRGCACEALADVRIVLDFKKSR